MLLLVSLNHAFAFDVIDGAHTKYQYEEKPLYPIPSHAEVVKSINTSSTRELPLNLNILIWNLYKGKMDTFSSEFTRLSAGKHLVLGQEMFLNESMNTLLKASDYRFITATSFYIGKEAIRTGVLTGSHANTTSIRYLRTIAKEPAANTPKMSLFTTYNLENTNKELLVANVHGINFVSNKHFISELTRIFNSIKNHAGPIILAGDFNTWNVERLDQLYYFVKKYNLKIARFNPDERTRFSDNVLDHFIFSQDITLREAKALTGEKGSDHTALEIKISIAE